MKKLLICLAFISTLAYSAPTTADSGEVLVGTVLAINSGTQRFVEVGKFLYKTDVVIVVVNSSGDVKLVETEAEYVKFSKYAVNEMYANYSRLHSLEVYRKPDRTYIIKDSKGR